MPRMNPPTEPDAPLPQTTNLVAAALNVRDVALPRQIKKVDAWQTECWDMYESVGPLRYATNWYANALARVKFHPARVTPDGLEPITSGPAFEAMQELWLKSTGMTEMVKAMAQNDFVAGEWYLVGRVQKPGEGVDGTPAKDGEVWEVASVEELVKAADKWMLDYGDGTKIEVGEADTILRMWSPSPRKRWLADSATKAALPDLREMRLYGRHIHAQVYSRIAGAGLLLVPSEMTFAKPTNNTIPGAEGSSTDAASFLVSLGNAMMAAINDPGAVEAFVPVVVKAPGEQIDKIKHLNFWSPMDEKVGEMRKDATRNLAITLDMPPEVLTGTADVNHWGSWQIDESAIKSHVEPGASRIAAALTIGYLRQLVDDEDIVVAYDSSSLRIRPNRSKEAIDLYDRGELNGKALRRETGFDEDDAPTKEDLKTWLLLKVAAGSATPEMVAAAIKELTGVDMPTESDNNRQARPDPSLVDHPTVGPPENDDANSASLMATCEAMTYRALERAGNRLKNATTARPACAAEEVYRLVQARPGQLNALLKDAWAPLSSLLHRTDYDADKVAAALDGYVRSLLTTQAEHDPDTMQRHVFAALGVR